MIQTNFIDLYIDDSYVTSEPVSLDEAKAQCIINLDFTDDDTYLTALITQCRGFVESFCNISLITKTITATVEITATDWNGKRDWDAAFYNRPINYFGQDSPQWFRLPNGPITSITSVTAANYGQVTPLVQDTDYFIRGTQFISMQILSSMGNIIIIYQTGWPVIPPDLKESILQEIAYRYENRGDSQNIRASAFTNAGLCEPAAVLAAPYIQKWV